MDKSFWFSADKFAIVLPNTALSGAAIVGDKLAHAIREVLSEKRVQP